MLRALTRLSVRLVERYLPDPYVFVLVLTAVAALAAMGLEQKTPVEVLAMWGGGFWSLLAFTMQMVLVLVTGYVLALTPLVTRALERLAKLAKTPTSAIVVVTLVGLTASWINWGFGLVVGAIFAREVARSVRVDYRLLIASAYSGFLVWHGGLAGSIPLTIATPGHFAADRIGIIPTSETIFSTYNLGIVLALFVLVPLTNRLMLPSDEESVFVDPALLDEKRAEDARSSPSAEPASLTPAGKLEESRFLGIAAGLVGLAFVAYGFVAGGASLNLDALNFTFLFLAILLHGTPRRLLRSVDEAIRGTGGIVLQFPFYAGIMAIMLESGLAGTISEFFVSFASAKTLPFYTFMSAGLVNLFVPSGGGQWAVQAPVVIQTAQALHSDMARNAMAVAWGDAWTNLIQPFWALPALAIAGLRAKDVMGYCLVVLVVSGVVISLGLTFL